MKPSRLVSFRRDMLETKEKIRSALQGKQNSPSTQFGAIGREGEVHPMFGRHHHPETKAKLRKAHLGNTYRRKVYEGFVLVSPTGEKFTRIDNLVGFAAVHHLEPGNLRSVLGGKRPYHKGWHLEGTE
jgi:hypothetical protein